MKHFKANILLADTQLPVPMPSLMNKQDICGYHSNILNAAEDYVLSAQVDSCQERADTSVRNRCLYDSAGCRTSWSL